MHGNYDVTITTAKSTNLDGIISGEVSKKDGESDNANFLKVDFYNKRNMLMGTEYVDIAGLER